MIFSSRSVVVVAAGVRPVINHTGQTHPADDQRLARQVG
jgi:hypothetical protein